MNAVEAGLIIDAISDKSILIVGDNCPNCKMVKEWMATNNKECVTVPAAQNMDLCRLYNIQSVPALVNADRGIVCRDVQSIIDYLKGE